MPDILEKPFLEVLFEHPSYTPGASLVENLETNLGRGLSTVYERHSNRRNLEAILAAQEDFERKKLLQQRAYATPHSLAAPASRWEDVPGKVAGLYQALVPQAIKAAYELSPYQFGAAFFDLGQPPRVTVVADVTRVQVPLAGDQILIKAANPLTQALQLQTSAQKPFGGPNPLTQTIVGALLGSGLGYGGGWLADKLLPDRGFEEDRSRLRRVGAILGGAMGAAPGLAWSAVSLANPKKTGGGLGSLVHGWPFRPEDTTDWYKLGSFNDRSGLTAETIPVDAFNRALWSDVLQPSNPYGTKSPWGNNEQTLHTPPEIAAAASGLVAGAGAARGSDRVSPWDIAVTTALTSAAGLGTGMLIGKTLGALAGLRPEYQQALQRAGTWGGLLTGLMNAAF